MNNNSSNFAFITLLALGVFLLNIHGSDGQTITRVSSIEFSGNSHYSDKELLTFVASKEGSIYNDLQFTLDIQNIIKMYQDAGYIDFKVTTTGREYNFDSSSVALMISVDEGKQVTLGEIILTGNKAFSNSSILNLMATKTGEVLSTDELNTDIRDILNIYEQRGYTFAAISVESIEEYEQGAEKKIRLRIKIDENERIKIDNIVIEGNTSTKKDVITREITLGEGSSISRENLVEIRRRLENLGYFESVEQPKILKYKNSTVLLIKVKEGNTNTFDGILGFVPPTQTEDRGYFTGLVNLSIRNLFGTGRKVEARFKKEIKSTQELELSYLEPWFLGYPINLSTDFMQRIEDSTYIKRELGLRTEAMITKKFTVSGIFDFERVIPTINSTSSFTIFDSRLLAAGVEIRFDSRDYIYNPASGILYKTSYSVGQKKIYNASSFENQDVPADFTIQKGMLDLDFYYSFFKRQSTLVGVHGVEIRSPRFEAADLYRFGGINSVRGYREGQFLGSRVAWSNLEFRYSLTRRSFAALFYDMGYYRKPADEQFNVPVQEGFIYGYGLGIRIETALGMFGVSYALGRGDSILEGKIHFGLVNDF
jgi:outer membrane protein insertion porin family